MVDDKMDFEGFLRENRYKVNYSLNRILGICVLAGPAIALGIMGGVFNRTTYQACVIISLVMAVLTVSNLLILRKKPYSYVPGMFALAAVDLLLCYMSAAHISIRLTWCLVPLLSLLFCNSKIYIGTSLFNYAVMALGTWLEAAHYAEVRIDFETPLKGFINVFAGCTIEAIIMFVAGYALSKATNKYYRSMLGQYSETHSQKQTLQEQLDILDSMAEIYDYVNLIDFKESTEMSLREENLRKLEIKEGQDHTNMTQGLRNQIAADMVDDFWRFTDITTVPSRLINRKSIAGEFISNDMGWFRAQYIRVSGRIDQKPEIVIYTIQNIDADKRREEQLIRISRTDELTGLFNRHCYEQDIEAIKEAGISPDLGIISADVNGLKTVNDLQGHAAGDEMIKGAASCLLSAIGLSGKVYRTGGDEFIAIVHSDDCAALIDEIRSKTAAWHGTMVESLSISVGFACHKDDPDAGIEDLEKIADTNMYADKAEYYRQSGTDRRRR